MTIRQIIIAALLIALPTTWTHAQRGLVTTKKLYTQQADISAYQASGAVPETDGKVVFSATIPTNGKTKEQLYPLLASFASFRFAPNTQRGEWREPGFFKNIEYAKVTKADKEEGIIIAQGAEEMIFSNKFLSQDYTQAFYLLTMTFTADGIDVKMNNIAYVYAGSGSSTRITAEEWITDSEALNKKGELRRINGKFRVKTIDLFNELTEEISQAIK